MAVCFRLYVMLILVGIVGKAYTDGSVKPTSASPPKYRDFNAPPPASPNKSVCDADKIRAGDKDKDKVCSGGCVAMSKAVNEIAKNHSDVKGVGTLKNQCGSFSGGTCDFAAKGKFPTCTCHTPNNTKRQLVLCRGSIHTIRKTANAGIFLSHHGTKLAEHGANLGQKAAAEYRKRVPMKTRDGTGAKSPGPGMKARFMKQLSNVRKKGWRKTDPNATANN